MIFFEGDPGDECFYIASGIVRIFSSEASGKEPVYFLRRHGEMFGLAEVLSKVPRSANAQAMTSTEVYLMHASQFDCFLSEDYLMARRVITSLGSRIRYLNWKINNFVTGNVLSRLSNFLIALVYDKLSSETSWSDPIELPIRITQELMASVTGATQPTISETLQQLQHEGLIRVERRKIILLNPMQLIQRAE